jgi:streptogramin lyase
MRSFLLAAVVGLFLIAAGSAQADPSVTGIFDLPDTPGQVALGPDGNVWVAINATDPDFAKIAPDGTVTPYTATDVDIKSVYGITAGPDGTMWATMPNSVVKFSVSNPAAAVRTTNTDLANPQRIVTGPDLKLWTASADKVVTFDQATPQTPTNYTVTGMSARGITSGNDGNLYVADFGGGRIIKMTTAGVPTPITVGGGPQEVASGPAGQVAYSNPGANPEALGLINGIVPTTPLTFASPPDPFGVTLGQDGAYWFAQSNSPALGRYTTSGDYTTVGNFPDPTLNVPRFITQGAGNTLWVTFAVGKKIARVSGVENPDTVPPTYASVKLTNTKFKVGTKKTALVAKKKKKPAKTGTTISYTLSENATTSIAVLKATSGRKSGKTCVKPTKKLKKAKKCTRYALVKTLTRLQLAGANKVAFSGRIGNTKLKPGKYRFSITGKDATGNVSAPITKAFTIVKK